MRKIKFRGRTLRSDKLVYGYFYYKEDYAIIKAGIYECFVKPESVAQFVGYDRNGNEVYEGDICIQPYFNDEREVYLGIPQPVLSQLILKETNNEIQNAAAQN